MLEKKNFYINGAWVAPKNKQNIEVINPATEKACAVISLGGKEDIHDAVVAAKEAFNSWGFSTKEERIELLEKKLLYKQKEEVCKEKSGYSKFFEMGFEETAQKRLISCMKQSNLINKN